MPSLIYLAHVKAWNGSSEVTLYFSDEGYVTGSTNLPPGGAANISYDCRIITPAIIQEEAWKDGIIGGQSRISFGVIELANSDGSLDYLTSYSFDGRGVTVIVGTIPDGGGTPTWVTVMTGKMKPPSIGIDRMTIIIRDRIADLNKPVCVNTFAGTNALPAGLEGTANDIGGSRKPKCFGKVTGVSPVCVNTSRLIFQVNDGAVLDVPNAYDRGAALTKGANYTSQTDMQTTAPAAGGYRVWPAGGYFRIGSALSGTLTCNITEGATNADRSAAQLAYDIALIAGLSAGDISAADITALDTLNSAQIGVYYIDDTTAIQALDDVLSSIGAFWGFDSLGILRMKRWDVVSGSPVVTLTSTEIKNIERISDENSVPWWRLRLGWQKNYTVQKSDIAAAVTLDRRAIIGAEYRYNTSSTPSVLTSNPYAKDMTINTAIIGSGGVTEAASERTRLMNLYTVLRQRYEVTAFLEASMISSIKIGDVVRLQINRFSMSTGVDFRVMGKKTDLNSNEITLSLWA